MLALYILKIYSLGPGSYDAKLDFSSVLTRSPVFSMASRFNIPSDSNMKPGPGAHRPEKVSYLMNRK